MKTAKALVAIISPFLNRLMVEKFASAREVSETLKRGVSIVVVTRPPKPREVDDPKEHEECIKVLKNAGIKVAVESKLHFKAAIIDNEIIYLGSINPLSVVTISSITF